MKRIREAVKSHVDAAIQREEPPKAPRTGVGLVVNVPGRRRVTIVNGRGVVTPAGEYYYKKTNQEAPRNFDYDQRPVRMGQREMIKLLDGTSRAVSIWSGGAWKQTNLGKKFYANTTVRYVVSFPVSVDIVRKNGTVYKREDWLASTATPLGEIEIKGGMSEHNQLAEVKRRTRAFLDALPDVDGEKIILPGYETYVMDTQREVEYNRLSISQQGNVEATLHRPLRHGRP